MTEIISLYKELSAAKDALILEKDAVILEKEKYIKSLEA
jgi:hypothetical protein